MKLRFTGYGCCLKLLRLLVYVLLECIRKLEIIMLADIGKEGSRQTSVNRRLNVYSHACIA